jgi:hypothetical protein
LGTDPLKSPELRAPAGPLGTVLATRGTAAAAEGDFVIEHREALIYMLCEAAELEHGIMCEYLYGVATLKRDSGEGLTPEQLAAVERWRRVVTVVATQEMLHLALVQNLLSAIGAAPHFARPNFPHPAGHYPPGVQLALVPFGEAALRHFVFLERPEGMALDDAEAYRAAGQAAPLMMPGEIVPRRQDFGTIGHLYRAIGKGFEQLAERLGERRLFCGPPRAQAIAANFTWPQLVAVTDLASARRAIDTIVEQGEGARGDWREAHFGRLVGVLDEYLALRAADGSFDPARPVMYCTVRQPEREVPVPLVTDPFTARCVDLCNVGYEVLLQVLQRYFAHTEETDEEIGRLADVAVGLMFDVISPLGPAITRLPVGPEHPGMTAGPSFELFYESDYLLPHLDAAWLLLCERLTEAAAFAGRLVADAPEGRTAETLRTTSAALLRLAGMLRRS